jgi:hypothetical protein
MLMVKSKFTCWLAMTQDSRTERLDDTALLVNLDMVRCRREGLCGKNVSLIQELSNAALDSADMLEPEHAWIAVVSKVEVVLDSAREAKRVLDFLGECRLEWKDLDRQLSIIHHLVARRLGSDARLAELRPKSRR